MFFFHFFYLPLHLFPRGECRQVKNLLLPLQMFVVLYCTRVARQGDCNAAIVGFHESNYNVLFLENLL
jgi:hypothetical protein